MEKKTLTVTGEATLSFTPDTIAVLLTYRKTSLTYEEASQNVSNITVQIKEEAVEAGLEESAVKTTEYRIRPIYRSEKDSYGNYHDAFKGYEGKASFEICFPFSNEVLSKVVRSITRSGLEINFQYRISNIEECRDKVIEEATKGAIRKAKLIAGASQVKLGSITNINYSYGVVRFEEENDYSILQSKCCLESASTIDINPADQTLNDRVTITWEIND